MSIKTSSVCPNVKKVIQMALYTHTTNDASLWNSYMPSDNQEHNMDIVTSFTNITSVTKY